MELSMVISVPSGLGSELVQPISVSDKGIFEEQEKFREQTILGFLQHQKENQENGQEEGDNIEETFTGNKEVFFSERNINITTFFAYLCFMICGIGYQIQFASLTSAVVYFVDIYGPSIFRIFVGVFNAPLLPISIFQLLIDQRLDVRFGSRKTFTVRIILTMIACSGIVFAVPFLTRPLPLLISCVAVLGIFNGIANGTFLALVSVFPIKTPIFWSMGQRMSTAMILAIQFALGSFSLDKETSNHIYFFACGSVAIAGLLSFLVLISLTVTRYKLRARDCELKMKLMGYKDSTNDEEIDSLLSSQDSIQSEQSQPATFMQLFVKVLPTFVSGMLILFSDIAVLTSLTYVPSTHKMMALILLYIFYFSDFAGRQLTLIPKRLVWNQWSELVAAIIRFLFVPATLLYIKLDVFRNDWAFFVFIGVFGVLGGYIRTLLFTIGPQVVSLQDRPRTSLILNLGVNIGTYAGIAFSFIAGATFLH